MRDVVYDRVVKTSNFSIYVIPAKAEMTAPGAFYDHIFSELNGKTGSLLIAPLRQV
jgi:hypothetical protein